MAISTSIFTLLLLRVWRGLREDLRKRCNLNNRRKDSELPIPRKAMKAGGAETGLTASEHAPATSRRSFMKVAEDWYNET
jgi:hypothetical protein